MDLDMIYQMVISKLPEVGQYILMALGGLVVVGRAYVALTPSEEDDKFLKKLEDMPMIGWVLTLLVKFSPVQRK